MYSAPPVAFPVGRFVWGRALWLVASAVGAASLTTWQWTSGASGALVVAAWVFWAMCAVGAAAWGPRQHLRQGRLFWSGEDWFWLPDRSVSQGEIQNVSLSVGFDAGFGLLLWVKQTDEASLKPGPWVCAWFEKKAMPSKWHGFRCAVYSQPKSTPATKMRNPDAI